MKKKKFNIPETALGVNLVDSIPRKVANLLRVYGIKDKRGMHGNVHWTLTGVDRHIYVAGVGTIHWNQTAVKATNVRFFQTPETEWVKNIEANLEKFVQLEKEIYEAVEKYCERITKERDISARAAIEALQEG